MKKTLIRFLLLAITGCLLQHHSYAQTNPDNVKASASKAIPGVINPLNENQTWTIVFSDKLQYWEKAKKVSEQVGGSFASLPTYTEMKAKKPRKDETPDFTFTLLTDGIKNVKRGSPVSHPKGGKVIEFTFTFPCLLQVSDKEGNILKTFELSSDDDIMTATIHPTFLNDVATSSQSLDIPVVTGFMSNDVDKEVDAKLNNYLARIEYNSYYMLANKALKIISHGYGYPKAVLAPVVMDLDKKEKAKFPELNEQIEKLKTAINEVFTASLNDDVRNRLLELGEYFESNYTEDSPKDVKKLYAFNSAMAYMLGGDSEEAYRQYNVFSPTFGMLGSSPAIFKDIYSIVTFMYSLYAIKDEQGICVLPPPAYTIDERKAMEEQNLKLANQEVDDARRQALVARNVNNEQGFLITNDGKRVEGKIFIDFIDLSPGQIVNMDLGKVVWVVTDNGRKAFRPKNVSYVMAGNKRFEPVTILESTGSKLMGAVLAGNFGSSYFMEVVYNKDNCSAFLDPTIDAYYVKSSLNEKVISYSEILHAKKAAEKYFGNNCPELFAKVKAKEFTSTKESLISFIDELALCTATK